MLTRRCLDVEKDPRIEYSIFMYGLFFFNSQIEM